MTNSYDVAHGLSQDAPGPLEPVEIAQQPGAAPATGNTARDQEMYVAGWLPIESAPKDGQSILGRGPRQDTVVIAWDEWAQPEARWKAVHLDVNGYECPEIVLRGEPTLWQPMPAPPCPTCNDQGAVGNILTAQPCPDCAAPGVSTVEDAQDGVTVLPDGSSCALTSFPLPATHWLYAEREYAPGAEEPKELPAPILTHAQRDAVVAAIRYAVRGATMCGKEQDFDPDALVQNAVYALCGPHGPTVAAPAAGDALALLDHPLLRAVLGYIEDAGPADVWGAAQSWMSLRDAELAAQRKGDA